MGSSCLLPGDSRDPFKMLDHSPFKGSKRFSDYLFYRSSMQFLESLENSFGMSSLKVIYQEWKDGQQVKRSRRSTRGNWWGVSSNQNLFDSSSSIPLCPCWHSLYVWHECRGYKPMVAVQNTQSRCEICVTKSSIVRFFGWKQDAYYLYPFFLQLYVYRILRNRSRRTLFLETLKLCLCLYLISWDMRCFCSPRNGKWHMFSQIKKSLLSLYRL